MKEYVVHVVTYTNILIGADDMESAFGKAEKYINCAIQMGNDKCGDQIPIIEKIFSAAKEAREL